MKKSSESHANAPRHSRAKNAIAGIVIAALTVLTQIVLRRELAPGEFGTVNALFGLILVLLIPLAALAFVLRRELIAGNLPNLLPPLLNRAALAWGLICVVLLFIILPLLQLPRESLHFFTLLAIAAGLLAICGRPMTSMKWCAIIGIGAAIIRLVTSAWAGHSWPTAESGLGALILAGLLAGLPALRDVADPPPLHRAWPVLRPAFVSGLATIGVALALALFGNADRIAAQVNLGTSDPEMNIIQTSMGQVVASTQSGTSYVDYSRFDEYQTAGLCLRGLLWIGLPMLFALYAQRAQLTRTTYASLRWFWIYLGGLFVGALFLVFGSPIVNALFVPSYPPVDKINQTWMLMMNFVGAFLLLGLLQGIAVFALASRRHIECFTLAVCSVAYTAFVVSAGHRASLMIGYMAGGAFISLAIVLFIGVIRYARTHP